ncbi:MAG: isochorismate synthase [Microcoleaceae cyanobacterium]
MSNLFQNLEQAVNYVYEGFARIFSPSSDIYPSMGVQPFEGTPYKGPSWKDS